MAPPREVTAATLFEEHGAFAWRVLRRLGVPDADADDACQEEVPHEIGDCIAPRALVTALRSTVSGVREGRVRLPRSARQGALLSARPEGLDQVVEASQLGEVALNEARALLDCILEELTTTSAPRRALRDRGASSEGGRGGWPFRRRRSSRALLACWRRRRTGRVAREGGPAHQNLIRVGDLEQERSFQAARSACWRVARAARWKRLSATPIVSLWCPPCQGGSMRWRHRRGGWHWRRQGRGGNAGWNRTAVACRAKSPPAEPTERPSERPPAGGKHGCSTDLDRRAGDQHWLAGPLLGGRPRRIRTRRTVQARASAPATSSSTDHWVRASGCASAGTGSLHVGKQRRTLAGRAGRGRAVAHAGPRSPRRAFLRSARRAARRRHHRGARQAWADGRSARPRGALPEDLPGRHAAARSPSSSASIRANRTVAPIATHSVAVLEGRARDRSRLLCTTCAAIVAHAVAYAFGILKVGAGTAPSIRYSAPELDLEVDDVTVVPSSRSPESAERAEPPSRPEPAHVGLQP